jgi:hypothetical protein
MSADNMEIIHPITGGQKAFVDSNNEVHDDHDCTFKGDHSDGLDVEDTCIICGKTLGDFIAEEYDPLRPRVPIILVPGGQEE